MAFVSRTTIRPALPTVGLAPNVIGMRNGLAPSATGVVQATGLLNGILAHRKQVVFRAYHPPGAVYNSTALATTWRGRFYSGPTGTVARVRMAIAHTNDTYAVAPQPLCCWYTKPAGGAETQQAEVYQQTRTSAGATTIPDTISHFEQTWTLVADTHYEVRLVAQDKCRVISAVIWLEPRKSLSLTSDASTNPRTVVSGNPIFDSFAADFNADLTTAWKQGGTHHGNWCMPSTTARTRTANTDLNLMDNTSTAWSSTSGGWYTVPYLHGQLGVTTVPAIFAVYGSMSAGSGTVKLVRSGATLGTITVNSSTAQWWTANVNLRGDQTSEKYDPLIAGNGVNTLSIWAASLYEHSA